jgi:hypothetical protein
MRTTNIQILESLNFLQGFEEKKYPQKISYGILKNLQIFSKEQEIYTKALRKIITAYEDKTEKDENGNPKYEENGLPVIKESSKEDFYKEVNDLLLLEIEINPYYIPESAFDYENTNDRYDVISPRDMFMLISILCESPADTNADEDTVE